MVKLTKLDSFEAFVDKSSGQVILTSDVTNSDPGPLSSRRPVLVFVHGWPDDVHIWKKNVTPELVSKYRCILIQLPHYGGKRLDKYSSWGYSFDIVVDLIAVTILHAIGSGNVHLITHDWGSMLGYVLQDRYPELIKSMVAVDIAPVLTHSFPSLKEIWLMFLFGIVYQYQLVLAFLIANIVPISGEEIGRMISVWTLKRLISKSSDPIHKDDYYKNVTNAYQNFLYWNLQVAFFKRMFGLQPFKMGNGSSKKKVPNCPLMFLWGNKTRKTHYRPDWLEAVSAVKGNIVQAVDSNHWVQWEAPEIFNKALEEWLAKQA